MILTETGEWSPNIYGVEYTTPVVGGTPVFTGEVPTGGYANVAALQLANRTSFLKQEQENMKLTDSGIMLDLDTVKLRAEQHYGSIDGHPLATPYSNGFMSNVQYMMLNDIKEVAYTNDYRSLDYKPPIEYTIRTTDFVARVGDRYYIKTNITVTLPSPAEFGLKDGDFIAINKCPCALVYINSLDAPIITVVGTEQSIIYDIDDEIIMYFDGTSWRV